MTLEEIVHQFPLVIGQAAGVALLGLLASVALVVTVALGLGLRWRLIMGTFDAHDARLTQGFDDGLLMSADGTTACQLRANLRQRRCRVGHHELLQHRQMLCFYLVRPAA